MPVTTTPAGRDVMRGNDPRIEENASAKLARKRVEAQRAADALNDRPVDTTTPLSTVGRAPLATLPEPPAPAKAARPTTLAEAAPWLLRPFAKQDVELKPTATTRDKTRALASPYCDMRVYFARLDKICGPENWSHTLTLSERGAVCALTVFGVTKSAAGDYPRDTSDENAATSAESQAFKRACTAFGLGRYLYSFPQTWAPYDESKKQFVDPAGVVAQMYASLPRGEEA
jgi:hypothetical protein